MQHKVAICLGVLVIPILSCSTRFFCLNVVSNYWGRFCTKCHSAAHGIHSMACSGIPVSKVLAIENAK